jgi:hypothetical protein
MSHDDDKLFENEVRRIARARWPQAQYGGAATIAGRERDGVFETDDVIHYIEATTSRSERKAKEDTKKIFSLLADQSRKGSMKGAIGWFITQHEPTADQREAVKQNGKGQVKCLSYAQFQQALVDVGQYLERRENHFFGSIANPEDPTLSAPTSYFPLELCSSATGKSYTLAEIASGIATGESYVILGDYGAGKSMTLRQLFYSLRDRYRSGNTPQFPIYLNLREHSGQEDYSEVLERHARKIGFEKPHTLISAWKAGFAILLIDGFDEITTLGISAARTRLREARRQSLTAVRDLLKQTPSSVGFVIAGREHFFNGSEEASLALGTRSKTQNLNVSELSRDQIGEYLNKTIGSVSALPSWLPTRPLLVSYVATRGLLSHLNEIAGTLDAIDGWNLLVARICDREAEISKNLDGPTLRKILERLATIARSTPDGLGPITQQQIRNAYIQICESEPDDQANLLLQRLPGLGVYRAEDDSRTFVDSELAEVCRAKDITDFILNPFAKLQDDGWRSAISVVNSFAGEIAISRVGRNLVESGSKWQSILESAVMALSDHSDLNTLKADTIVVAIESEIEISRNVVLEGEFFEQYTLIAGNHVNHSRITFRDCLFECIEIGDSATSDNLPKFQGCVFASVRGRSGVSDLPENKFDARCTFERFTDSAATQSSILNSQLTTGEKIILTLLRKLFVQSVSGRAESALIRGLDLNDRQLVPEAIRLLQQHGMVSLYNRGDGHVWVPVRKEINRARRILAAPATCGDTVIADAKAIGKGA